MQTHPDIVPDAVRSAREAKPRRPPAVLGRLDGMWQEQADPQTQWVGGCAGLGGTADEDKGCAASSEDNTNVLGLPVVAAQL